MVARLDGHRVAYGYRRAQGALVRLFCGETVELTEAELKSPATSARTRLPLVCGECHVEVERLSKLRRDDPAAYEAEMRQLEGEGRGTPS
jgi:hypothetical protein